LVVGCFVGVGGGGGGGGVEFCQIDTSGGRMCVRDSRHATYLEGCGIFEIREFFPHKRPTKETYKERERVRNRQDSSF